MDVKPIAVGMLKASFRLMSKDLEVMPEEAFTKNFGGTSRSVADIVYETILVNDDITRSMIGEEMMDWPEGWITAPEGFDSKATVMGALKESCDRIVMTVDAMSEDDMAGVVVTEHGETNRFERCRFMALHTWYHSGQLNFMQTLMGDSEFHWAK